MKRYATCKAVIACLALAVLTASAGAATLTVELWGDNPPIHLGDSTTNLAYGPDAVTPYGVVWSPQVYLPFAPPSAQLVMEVSGVLYEDPIFVNGEFIGFVPVYDPNGPYFESFTIPIPVEHLQLGTNTITIESQHIGYYAEDPQRLDYDDIWLRNVTFEAVPEPVTMSLLTLGGMALLKRKP